MTKRELRIMGFVNVDGFLELTLNNGKTLVEGDKMGYLDVFDLDDDTIRFNSVETLTNYIYSMIPKQ